MYNSNFSPTNDSIDIMRNGNIIEPSESASDMIERVVATIAKKDLEYSGHYDTDQYSNDLGERLDDGRIIMSTTIMTNAGRYLEKPLSACTMPTAKLTENIDLIKQEIDTLHQQGMGTGFDLNPIDDPVAMLKLLNKFANDGAAKNKEDRPVGNMAVLSVYHPKIIDFITSKMPTPNSQINWKFNISVDMDDAFFDKLATDSYVTLADSTRIKASEIFNTTCEAASSCADPGLIFLDRMNARNPIPAVGNYKTTAPCAEVGLVEGESCQFGYINIGKFIINNDKEIKVNYDDLSETVKIITRALDDALSISIDNHIMSRSISVMEQKRKIGIGLCGVADALSIAGFGYDSPEARKLISNILSYVNYTSKVTSVELAHIRGSALAMDQYQGVGNRYYDKKGFLDKLFGQQACSDMVSSSEWINLENTIKSERLLRNTSTIALPPTGRSALVHGASTGIEPHFTIDRISDEVRLQISQHMGKLLGHLIEIDQIKEYSEHPKLKDYLSTAQTISPEGHIRMLTDLQKFTDEAISKTVNMPSESNPSDIRNIYIKAHELGASGITIYVDKSNSKQPIAL